MMVDIKGLNKAEVLRALYLNSHEQGMGILQARPVDSVTVETCAGILNAGATYIDYLFGRVIKVDLSGDEFDPRLYDRDCGEGAAQRAVNSVRYSGRYPWGSDEDVISEGKKEMRI